MAPMDPSGSFFPILQPNQMSWTAAGSSCMDMYDVKSETEALNSVSSRESCMSRVFQGVSQRSGLLPQTQHLSPANGLSPATFSDGGDMIGGFDWPGKCAYSTVTAAQRVDPFLNRRVPALQMESLQEEPSRFLSNDRWTSSAIVQTSAPCGDGLQQRAAVIQPGPFESLRPGGCLVKPRPGGALAAMKSDKENQVVGRRNNGRSLSDEASFDTLLSTVSSTSESMAREQEEEDDDALCTTSVAEPPSQSGRRPSLGVAAGIGSMVLSTAAAAAHYDEQQQQISGLTSAGGSCHSADQRDLGSPSSITLGAQQHQDHDRSLTEDAKGSSNDHSTVNPMDLKVKRDVDLGMIVDDDSWCKKMKESPGVGGVYFSDRGSNLVNAARAAVDPATSYLMRGNNNSNMYRPQSNNSHNNSHGLAALDADSNTGMAANNRPAAVEGAAKAEPMLRDENMANLAHAALMFRSTFAAVDIAAVESSRPKRRNVKISKDPQSVAARHRRERISDRIRVLQRLVPGGTKMDTASMLDEAINYVKFLKAQVHTLETVSGGVGGFDPHQLGFGPGPLYRNSPFHNYSPMSMDSSSGSQGASSAPDHNQFGAGAQNLSYPAYSDSFREQYCH